MWQVSEVIHKSACTQVSLISELTIGIENKTHVQNRTSFKFQKKHPKIYAGFGRSGCAQWSFKQTLFIPEVPSSRGISMPSAAINVHFSIAGCFLPSLSMYSRPRPGRLALRRWLSVTHLYCTLHTLSTSGTSLLNSSKHPQEPAASKTKDFRPLHLNSGNYTATLKKSMLTFKHDKGWH